METTLQLSCVLVCQFAVFFSVWDLYYKCFSYNDMFFINFGLCFFVGTFSLRMEITLQLRFFLFVIVTYFLLCCSYFIYLFDVVTFFMTLELRFILVRSNYIWKQRYNNVPFLFVTLTYFLLRPNYVIYLLDVVTFFDYVRITL